MLTPAQLVRRVAKEARTVAHARIDPELGLDLAPPMNPGTPELAADAPALAIVRGEHVSAQGDLVCSEAAAALLEGAQQVVAVMAHLDDDGRSRVASSCAAPATAVQVVTRIITELCVLDVTERGLVVREVAPGVSAREVQERTSAPLMAGPDLTVVES
jgi:acyl CoA:acetate/3-ketoacid CoA transferase beta subunit